MTQVKTVGRGLAVVAKNRTSTPPTFTVEHWLTSDLTVPTTKTDFDWFAIGF